jgi:calcium-binding protein CML
MNRMQRTSLNPNCLKMAVATSEFSLVFSALDRDDDGKISLRLCVKAEDMSAEDAEDLVASLDTDGDGLLNQEEFLNVVQVVEMEEVCRGLKEPFRLYEMRGEGCITPLSLKRMLSKLGAHQGINECQAMICRFDLDGDGVLSSEEFKVMMHGRVAAHCSFVLAFCLYSILHYYLSTSSRQIF